ncbi:lysophospholipid acyltransferase family protein [Reinekea marinisedimentorum]|uniref:L-ornithine N(alpha)-acyltransferase n=1 Tax=Reinekea marinisedimentorum TaxID=230495 RepID=A0A4R3I6R9_9GAMM|nr:GNAT family N-acyltransferase [Reinekea marinisedimentorum]TCS41383.1 putative hemolysin [Reinekea marinisedimentorum]
MTSPASNPFKLPIQPTWLANTAEAMLGLKPLAQAYEARPEQGSVEGFLDYTLSALGCTVRLDGKALEEVIPESGPVIVVANHPFGGIEGVALTRALLAVRPDTKVLTNQLLSLIPELKETFLGVDVLGKKTAHKNTAGVRAAHNHLQQGNLLLVFPAGQVSSRSWNNLQVQDREWNSMVGRLAQKHEATCIPVYVHGQNPEYFQLAGLVHKRLRTALLPRQLSNKAGRAIRMTVGEAITRRDYAQLESSKTVTDLLRMSTYLLANTAGNTAKPPLQKLEQSNRYPLQEITRELAGLAPYKLLTKGSFDVYCAPYEKLNKVFDLICIAREQTFRAVGEGTGNDMDTDQYDPYYEHLFIWDTEQNAIVGGYRIGRTDRIVEQQGVNGLYSRSLYKYDERFLNDVGSALEMGRSFITEHYQRHPAALDSLWRGIGHYVVKHPHYKTLFGCVSISSAHSKMARAFISDAMMESFQAEQKFLENVKPIVPLRVRGKVWTGTMLASIKDISVFNKLVGQCDPGKTIPVLLRHYLALNGRFVGFSVNRGFNDSLDGLIMVDLTSMPDRYLKRYLGKEGATSFLEYWKDYDQSLPSEHRSSKSTY